MHGNVHNDIGQVSTLQIGEVGPHPRRLEFCIFEGRRLLDMLP